MPFRGAVVVTEIERDGGRRWRLVEPLRYDGRDETFVVPAGFDTDFASVPRIFTWLIPRYGRYTKAAILHDFLRREAARGAVSYADTDGIFRRVMREEGVALLRRWLMWAAVRWDSVVRHQPSTLWRAGATGAALLVAVTVPALAFLAVPAAVVTVWLALFAVAELLVWVPARLLGHRQVNPPRPTLPR